MTSYLESIERRRETTSAAELLWEVAKAFDEAPPDSSARTSPRWCELRDLVRFTQCDAIATWLRDERPALERALAFARSIDDRRVADLLVAALAGKAQPDPVFTVQLPGHAPRVLDVDAGAATRFGGVDWSGTDIALSFAMADFEEAVLDELAAAATEFELAPPRAVVARRAADAAVARETETAGAAELFQRIVRASHPRIEAGTEGQVEQRLHGQGVELPVAHRLNPPATAGALASIERRFGAAVKELLEVYALHDGAELFCHEGECGFHLGPIAEWGALHERAVEWAEGVTWQDDPAEVPRYLYSAIAFGMIPGDAERWLLITEGTHAGKVMLSDTDLIEDEPRFDSISEFLAVLLNDGGRILGSGGYVRYAVGGVERYPMRYLCD